MAVLRFDEDERQVKAQLCVKEVPEDLVGPYNKLMRFKQNAGKPGPLGADRISFLLMICGYEPGDNSPIAVKVDWRRTKPGAMVSIKDPDLEKGKECVGTLKKALPNGMLVVEFEDLKPSARMVFSRYAQLYTTPELDEINKLKPEEWKSIPEGTPVLVMRNGAIAQGKLSKASESGDELLVVLKGKKQTTIFKADHVALQSTQG